MSFIDNGIHYNAESAKVGSQAHEYVVSHGYKVPVEAPTTTIARGGVTVPSYLDSRDKMGRVPLMMIPQESEHLPVGFNESTAYMFVEKCKTIGSKIDRMTARMETSHEKSKVVQREIDAKLNAIDQWMRNHGLE